MSELIKNLTSAQFDALSISDVKVMFSEGFTKIYITDSNELVEACQLLEDKRAGSRIEALPSVPLPKISAPSKPKPKHHNGRCNQVNRSKNKASRKARKQNRR